MSPTAQPATGPWTAADLLDRFGAIPLYRVRHDPAPGMGTEQDVVDLNLREDRLYELVDRVLLEKTVGTFESYLAGLFVRLLANFVLEKNLGIVLPPDGMLRLRPGLVRIPDVSFISWQRLPNRRIPGEAIASVVPDLAVEVISQANTREEMDRKLQDYFDAGVRLVWYVYPNTREVRVYASAARYESIGADGVLDGLDVLPGLSLHVREIFADPGPQLY